MAGRDRDARDDKYDAALAKGLPPVVTEGDSWFDYPLSRNLIDFIDDEHRFAFKRLESSGDTVRNMLGMDTGCDALEALAQVVHDEQATMLFFSGGGNDFVAVADRIFRRRDIGYPPKAYLTPAWQQTLDEMRGAFERMIARIGPMAPIWAHGYDHFVPDYTPVTLLDFPIAGPWFWPAMNAVGITTPAIQRAIGAEMIVQFNRMLDDLERQYVPKFVHVNLIGTLTIADWKNEIHPTAAGFDAVATKFLAEVDRKRGDISALAEADGLAWNY